MVCDAKRLVTPAGAAVTTLAQAKDHLRVSHSVDDTYIQALIGVAESYVEEIANRALITQTWQAWYCGFGCFTVPKPRLVSVVHLKYYPVIGSPVTVPSTDYDVDEMREPGEVRLAYSKQWPTVELRQFRPVEIQFTCGYGNSEASVPKPVKQAILLLITHWYENRVPIATTGVVIPREVPLTVTHLLANHVARGTE